MKRSLLLLILAYALCSARNYYAQILCANIMRNYTPTMYMYLGEEGIVLSNAGIFIIINMWLQVPMVIVPVTNFLICHRDYQHLNIFPN
jgi:hypothetical protein